MDNKYKLSIKNETGKLNVFLNAYQVLRNNLEFYKRQQWQISYYGIAINVALSFLYLEKSGNKVELSQPLFLFGLLASIICILIIVKLECSICDEVKSVRKIEDTIPLLKSITSREYTTMNVKKNVQNNSCIFETAKESSDSNTHSRCVCYLALLTVIASFGFLFWILNLK